MSLKQTKNWNGKLYAKLKSVFDKNSVYDILNRYHARLNGNDVNFKFNPAFIDYKQDSTTSGNVERVFLQLKHLSSNTRYKCTEKNLDTCIAIKFEQNDGNQIKYI